MCVGNLCVCVCVCLCSHRMHVVNLANKPIRCTKYLGLVLFFSNRIGQSGRIHLYAWLRCIHKFNLKRYDYFAHTEQPPVLFEFIQSVACVEMSSICNVQFTIHNSKKENGSYKLSDIGIDSNMVYCCCCIVFIQYYWINYELSTNYYRTIVNSSSLNARSP